MNRREMRDLAAVKARQGVELALRELGQSPETRAARRAPAFVSGKGGPRVLVLSPRDWAVHVQWDALIARALAARGADVQLVTCGGGLETCDRVNVHEGPPPPCHTCSRYTGVALPAHGLPVSLLIDHYPDAEWPELDGMTLVELQAVVWHDLPLGQLVDVPVKWFLCSAALETDPLAASTYRSFLRVARQIATSISTIFDAVQPEVLVMLNGLFLFEAVAGAVARRRDIRIVTYERAHVDGLLFFAHEQSASRYAVDDHWRHAQDVPLTDNDERTLDEYLDDRRRGLRSFVQIWPEPKFELADEPQDRTRVVLFTNVTWDSAAIGLDGAFANVRTWLLDTIAHLGLRPDLDVIVRIHPSEVVLPKWRTREPMRPIIDAAFPHLPANVRIVDADDQLSSYSLVDTADVGVVYTSTVGLELALAGVPVVVGGRPHYAAKGFTVSPENPDDHRRLLDEVLRSPKQFVPDVTRARRYAHLFFFTANLPRPPAFEPVSGLVRLEADFAEQIRPGHHAGLDAMCAGILESEPFRVST